jgi:hypothetical protein
VESFNSGGRGDVLQHKDGSAVSVHGHSFLSERKLSARSSNAVVLSSQASLLDLNPRIDQVCSVSSLKLGFVFVKFECYWIQAKYHMAVADRFGMICGV